MLGSAKSKRSEYPVGGMEITKATQNNVESLMETTARMISWSSNLPSGHLPESPEVGLLRSQHSPGSLYSYLFASGLAFLASSSPAAYFCHSVPSLTGVTMFSFYFQIFPRTSTAHTPPVTSQDSLLPWFCSAVTSSTIFPLTILSLSSLTSLYVFPFLAPHPCLISLLFVRKSLNLL